MKILTLLISTLFAVSFTFAQVGGVNGSRSVGGFDNALPIPSNDPFANPSLQLVFEENMDDVSLLETNGWEFNDVDGSGLTSYFQGNVTVFNAYNGLSDSYLGQNYNGAFAGGNLIDQWLITPVISSIGSTTFSFVAGSVASAFDDHFYIYYSPNASANLNQFVLLRDRTIIADGWNRYEETVESTGYVRFAIRYYETDGGSTGTNSDYWGLDNVQVYGTPSPYPVPISIWWIIDVFVLIVLGVVVRRLF